MTPGEIVLTCPSSAWKAYLVTQIRKKDRFLHLSAFLFFVNGRFEIITQVLLTSSHPSKNHLIVTNITHTHRKRERWSEYLSYKENDFMFLIKREERNLPAQSLLCM